MSRIDSRFDVDASCYVKTTDTDTDTDTERYPVHRSNTAPTRPRNPRKTISDSPSNTLSTGMANPHPESEKRPSVQRRSNTETRRPSVGSSSENSTTKSRSRGHGSKPSSRRTSCTLVDPSRPARHYRIKSSQTVPTGNRGDIDDVLALHFRSCSLFENPTYYSPFPSPVISRYGGLGVKEDTSIGSGYANAVSGLPAQERTDHIGFDFTDRSSRTSVDVKQSEETIVPPETANTTMHWMSPGTRQRQYEKIDRANSGLRGFVSRVVPRCVSGPPPPKFYEKDKSDAGSVRRYRICDDEEEKGEDEDHEKSAKDLRYPARAVSTMKSKRWGCF